CIVSHDATSMTRSLRDSLPITFCRMDRRVTIVCKVKWQTRSRSESEPEQGDSSMRSWTRNCVIWPCPGWRSGTSDWRPDPTYDDKCGDAVRAGEKSQSNREIG